jgi:hypothetical protein
MIILKIDKFKLLLMKIIQKKDKDLYKLKLVLKEKFYIKIVVLIIIKT